MKKILLYALMALPFVFTSCGDDDKDEDGITLGKKEYKMNFKDKVQTEATSNLEITYKTDNDFIATVSESGLITGGRVGKTDIVLNNTKDTKKVSVIIEPKAEIYPEPELSFGETKANIIKKFGKPTNTTVETISYNNYSSKAPYIIYFFDGKSDNSKLEGISVIVNTSYSDALAAHLDERYLMIEGDDELIAVGTNSNKLENATMTVGLRLYETTYWMVLYTPFTYSKSNLKSLHQIENAKNAFKKFDDIHLF